MDVLNPSVRSSLQGVGVKLPEGAPSLGVIKDRVRNAVMKDVKDGATPVEDPSIEGYTGKINTMDWEETAYEQTGGKFEEAQGSYGPVQESNGAKPESSEGIRRTYELGGIFGPVEWERLEEISKENGVSLHMESYENWPERHANHFAYSHGGEIFIRDNVPKNLAQQIIFREISPMMRQNHFIPYIFSESTEKWWKVP